MTGGRRWRWQLPQPPGVRLRLGGCLLPRRMLWYLAVVAVGTVVVNLAATQGLPPMLRRRPPRVVRNLTLAALKAPRPTLHRVEHRRRTPAPPRPPPNPARMAWTWQRLAFGWSLLPDDFQSPGWDGHIRAMQRWLGAAAVVRSSDEPVHGNDSLPAQWLYWMMLDDDEMWLLRRCAGQFPNSSGAPQWWTATGSTAALRQAFRAASVLVAGDRSSSEPSSFPSVAADRPLPTHCGGACCRWCLVCSPFCASLPEGCGPKADAKALQYVLAIRVARELGVHSTDRVGHAPQFSLSSPEMAAYVEGQLTRADLASSSPLWRAGVASERLHGLSTSTGGVVAVLYSPRDVAVWKMLRSVCLNLPEPHPLLLFWTEEPPPLPTRQGLAAAAAGPGCVQRQVWIVEVPAGLWDVEGLLPDGGGSAGGGGPNRSALHNRDDGATVSDGGGGYRRMCWFWHHTVHSLPCLAGVDLLLRLDTDSEIVTAPTTDPIRAVARAGASYGFAAFCFDNPFYTQGLWQHTAEWLRGGGVLPWAGFEVPEPETCQPRPAMSLSDCPVPMFYTNLEVMRRSFFRRPDVDRWLRSLRAGVGRYRWGDAPLRALTVALYARESDVVHLNDFAYRHGRGDPAQTLQKGNGLRINWALRQREYFHDDQYFLGICFERPKQERPKRRGQGNVVAAHAERVERQGLNGGGEGGVERAVERVLDKAVELAGARAVELAGELAGS